MEGKEASANTEGQDPYDAGSSLVNSLRSAATPFPLDRRSAQNQRGAKGAPASCRHGCLELVTAGRRAPAGGGLCHPRPGAGPGRTSGDAGTACNSVALSFSLGTHAELGRLGALAADCMGPGLLGMFQNPPPQRLKVKEKERKKKNNNNKRKGHWNGPSKTRNPGGPPRLP